MLVFIFFFAGSKLSIGSMLCAGGVSFIIGSVSFSPHLAYAMDGKLIHLINAMCLFSITSSMLFFKWVFMIEFFRVFWILIDVGNDVFVICFFITNAKLFFEDLDINDAGLDILVDDQDFLGGSDVEEEEDSHALWTFVRKFWLPSLFLLTLLVYWDNPILLMTKVIFFLLSTKPSPLSVYVFVEQV